MLSGFKLVARHTFIVSSVVAGGLVNDQTIGFYCRKNQILIWQRSTLSTYVLTSNLNPITWLQLGVILEPRHDGFRESLHVALQQDDSADDKVVAVG